MMLHRGSIPAVVVLLGAAAAAQATRIDTNTKGDQPAGDHSTIVASSGPDILDSTWLGWVQNTLYNAPLNTPAFGQLLSVFGQCFSGGFIDEAQKLTGNVGMATAAYWGECSKSTDKGNTFLNPWADAVDGAAANDGFLDAFKTAVANDIAAKGADPTSPQYYSSEAAVDTTTLGNGLFALLFVGDTSGRPDYFLDISRIRSILTTKYGYLDQNIFAYYGDGARQDQADPGSPALPDWIDGAGTAANYQTGLGSISSNLNPNGADGVFLWNSNHGDTVPEPGTWALAALGAALFALARRCGRMRSPVRAATR
jgi:hypothetical protein